MKKLFFILVILVPIVLNAETFHCHYTTQSLKVTEPISMAVEPTTMATDTTEIVFTEPNNDSINVRKYVYCEIVKHSSWGMPGEKLKIQIDFGQEVSTMKPSRNRLLTDSEGNAVKFNSMIEALNYMGAQGWTFVQAYSVIRDGNTQSLYYLLQKEVKK